MKTKFPLYAKILFWFFLNVVVLAVVFFFVARVQFRFGLDSLIAGKAGERMQSITKLIMEDLRDRPRLEIDSVLKRFGEAYSLDFFIFRNDGAQIAGEPMELPPQVQEKIRERRAMIPPQQRRPEMERHPELDRRLEPERRTPFAERLEFGSPPPFFNERESRPQPAGLVLPTSMLHTSEPNGYWVLIRTVLPEAEMRRQMPVTLVAKSGTLSAGGLFFDFTPWIMAAIAVILISLLFWFPLVRGITKSISRITTATERMAEGQFDVRLEDKRRDELGLLSDAVNRMASRLSGFVTGQKTFLGDIAHELCSPIARMQMALGIIEQRAEGEPDSYFDDLREEVEHMSNLVNELLSFSKASIGKSKIKLQSVALRSTIDRAVAREAGAINSAEIKIDVAEDLQVLAEPELLLRSVANVIRNAVRYASHAGPITISTVHENAFIILNIEDCGAGIPAEAIAQVFDPFYRIDSSRSRETGGVGLGLSIVKTCIESCGGTVSCENREPSGLRVAIRIPAADLANKP
ncbi:MAG: HAMP domain-containing sensor histidine kinase [Verrucomicrobiota bacterium]